MLNRKLLSIRRDLIKMKSKLDLLIRKEMKTITSKRAQDTLKKNITSKSLVNTITKRKKQAKDMRNTGTVKTNLNMSEEAEGIAKELSILLINLMSIS